MSTLQADPSALNEFFNKTAERLVGQNAITDDISDLDSASSSHNSFKLQKVTCNDVLRSFKSLLFNRIGQHSSFFYQANSRIHCLTFNIHNQQFNWRIEFAYVSPIRKVSNQKELKDYRPLSILLILSKVYEKGFTSNYRLRWTTASIQQTPIWLSQKPLNCKYLFKIIWRRQNGYETKFTMAVFTDYSKAFDTIDFFTLIQKMHSLNFSTDDLYWVFNYLTHRRHLQIDSNCSSLLTAQYRVLQGSILGPILFNLCVVDISSVTPNSNHMQYADDPTLYQSCKINQKDTCIKEHEKDLNSTAKCSIETNVVFNFGKTKLIFIASNQQFSWHKLQDEQLQICCLLQ